MGDPAVELLRLQVQQLVLRVDYLERQVSDLQRARNHGAAEELELVSEAPVQQEHPRALPNTIPWLLRSLLCLLLLFSCAQPCEGESYLPKRELRERGLRVTGASLCLRAALVVPGLLHLVILLHCAASCKHLLSYTL